MILFQYYIHDHAIVVVDLLLGDTHKLGQVLYCIHPLRDITYVYVFLSEHSYSKSEKQKADACVILQKEKS